MSLVSVPPKIVIPRHQRPKKTHWTIHAQMNDIFSMKLNETTNTSVVGFKKIEDAILIGQMIDTHFVTQKEFPDTKSGPKLILPSPKTGDVLHHVYVQQWDFDDLRMTCTKNILELLSVDGLVDTKHGYSFRGNQTRFNEILEL